MNDCGVLPASSDLDHDDTYLLVLQANSRNSHVVDRDSSDIPVSPVRLESPIQLDTTLLSATSEYEDISTLRLLAVALRRSEQMWYEIL